MKRTRTVEIDGMSFRVPHKSDRLLISTLQRMYRHFYFRLCDVIDSALLVESDGVEEALLKVADSYVQLLTPISDTSPVAKYLANKGEGLHHIGYRVDDCGVALQAIKDAGGRVIDEAPRPGSRGTTVAFVHPKASFGTLIELVQE